MNNNNVITDRQLFFSHIAQTSAAPIGLEIVKAEGNYQYDIHGKKYFDLISGFSVANIGHSHPTVIEAVKKQAENYMHLIVYGEFIESSANTICGIAYCTSYLQLLIVFILPIAEQKQQKAH